MCRSARLSAALLFGILMLEFCFAISIIAQDLQVKFVTEPIPGVPLEKGLISKMKTAPISKIGQSSEVKQEKSTKEREDITIPQTTSTAKKSFDVGTAAPAPISSSLIQEIIKTSDIHVESGNGLSSDENTEKRVKENYEMKIESESVEEQSTTQNNITIKVPLKDLGGAMEAGNFIISSGTQNYAIADAGYRWVQLWTNLTIPAGSQVTNVQYRLRIDDTGDPNTFFCGDYEVWLSSEANGSPNKYLLVYNNLGARTDGGYDDDAEDDSDIYLNWRSTAAFNGENPSQKWCVWIEDVYAGDAGELEYIEFQIYYETPGADQPNLIANYTPDGWAAPIVASSVSGTNTDGPNLQGGATTYIDFAFANLNADIPTTTTFYTYLYDNDGATYLQGWYTAGIPAGYYSYVEDYEHIFNISGYTTLKTVVDATGAVAESNESDNAYSRQIGPFGAAQPDIDVSPTSLDIYESGAGSTLPAASNSETNKLQKSNHESLMGLIIPPEVKDYWLNRLPNLQYNVKDLKASIDWSSDDSPVKDQGSCGSCWAFSTVALIENLSSTSDLSEQSVVSCTPPEGGISNDCSGGWHGYALQYINGDGVPNESCYPYASENGDCSNRCSNPSLLVRVNIYDLYGRWGLPTSSTVSDLIALLQSGPVLVSMDVPADNTFNGSPGYTGGIYNYSGSTIPSGRGHSVLVVGYDDVQQFFKVKNSWGSDWGENGYFRIAFDDVTDDVHFGGYACTASGIDAQGSENGFAIANTGSGTLEVSSISSNKNWLTFNPTVPPTMNISAGSSEVVQCNVNWSLVPGLSDQATVTINSNDPDENPVYSTVTAYPAQAPAPPTLASPSNGAPNQPTSLTLDWNASTGATSYRLQVDNNSDFSSPYYNQAGLTATEQAVSGLANGTTYHWRVNASNAAGTSAYSSVWSFTTATGITPPPPPILVSPLSGATNQPTTLTLDWDASTGATSYRLQVDDNSDFSSQFYDQAGLTATQQLISGLTNSTTYYWRVNASNAAGPSSWSSVWQFTTTATPSSPWPVVITSKNATIAVPVAINPTLDGQALKNGDAIGAFFLRDGAPVCGGYCIWQTGQSGAITAYGDDEISPLKDGFSEGELINYRIWDSASGTDWSANATYQMGGPNYSTNGIMVLASLAGSKNVTQNIALPSGWSMISSYVSPQDPLLTTMMAAIASQMTLMKNGAGQVYWPAYGINTIGSWNYRHGYQIYMQSPLTLAVAGSQLQPESVTLPLAQGWNMAAYLRTSAMPIQTALSSIISNMILVKNGAGQVYWPAYGINTIGSMQPGQGYQMYLTQATDLTYPANALAKEQAADGAWLPACVHFGGSVRATGSSAAFVWRDLPFADGDEIAVFAGGDQLVGSGVVHKGQVLLLVWGDDAATGMKDGASGDEVLSLRHWARNENAENLLMPSRITDALTGQIVSDGIRYRQDGAYLLEGVPEGAASVAAEYQLAQNYPNPFNPATEVQFALPKTERVKLTIYNARGEHVRLLLDETAARGIHSLIWNGTDDLGRQAPGGIYLLQMSCDSFNKVVKMLYVK